MCGFTRSVCWFRVGGFEAKHDICSVCLAGIDWGSKHKLRKASIATFYAEILLATRERT
jgi:hypothetical protein